MAQREKKQRGITLVILVYAKEVIGNWLTSSLFRLKCKRFCGE